MLKKLLFLTVSVLWTSVLIAQSLAPQAKASLYDHMNEVNKEWASFFTDAPTWLLEDVQFNNDQERIQKHLQLVVLSLRDVQHSLNEQAESKRQELLNRLAVYAEAGQFPKNIYHTKRQPYFIDHEGTACAVGHLIQESGHESLAEYIARETNYAYVEEMQFPELMAWAGEHGFEKAELAWIQPGYPPQSLPFEVLGNGIGADATIHALYTDEVNDILYAGGTFTSLDDNSISTIAQWDGNTWQAVGNTLDGEVYDIGIFDGTLFVTGVFNELLPSGSGFAKVAYLENGSWVFVETDARNVKCLDMELYNGLIYFACEIGPPMGAIQSGLFAIDPQTKTFVPSPIIEGHVYTLKASPSGLGIAGDFHYVYHDFQQFTINHFMIYDGTDITYTKTSDDGPLTALHYRFDRFITANNEEFMWFDGNQWSYSGGQQFMESDARVTDFHDVGLQIVASGNFTFFPFVGNFGRGLVQLDYYEDQSYFTMNGFAYMDSTVQALEAYDNQLILGGDFTKSFNPWGGDTLDLIRIAAVDVDFSTSIDQIPTVEDQVNVFAHNSELIIDFISKPNAFQIELYDSVGRLVFADQEPSAVDRMAYSMQHLNHGAYFYRMRIGDQAVSGKLLFSK